MKKKANKGMELTENISGLNRKGLWLIEFLWPAAHP
jgi:hypothetical protein